MVTIVVESGNNQSGEHLNYIKVIEPQLKGDEEFEQFDRFAEINEFIESQIQG